LTKRDEELLGMRTTALLKAQALAAKKARAIQLAGGGRTPSEIGKLLGCTGKAVADWLREAGVAYRTKAGDGLLASVA
jgi:DNA-directed RNA polymerase specialized sigma24 family protein